MQTLSKHQHLALPAISEALKYRRDVDLEPMDVSDSEEQARAQEQTIEEQARYTQLSPQLKAEACATQELQTNHPRGAM